MSKQEENTMTPIQVSLHQIKDTLIDADQTKLLWIRTRFKEMINEYANDIEATAILHLLMAEYTLETKIKMEESNGDNRRSPVDVH